ncbi:9119_t:CDS:1, partial [Acaulospora colombiana]
HSRANSMRKIRFAPLPDPRKLEELELVMDSPLGLIPTSLAVSALSTSPSKSNNGVLGEETSPASAVMDQDPATPASQVSQFSSVSASTANTVDSSATAPAATRSSMSGGGAPSVASTDDGRAETDTDSRHRKSKSWSKRIFRPLLLKSTSTSTSAPSTPNPANASQGYSSDGLWRTTSRDSVTSNTSNDSGVFGLTRWGTSTGFADRFVPRTSGTPLGRTQSLGTTSAPQAKSHPLPKKKPGHAASSSLGGGGRRNQRMLNGRVYGYRQSNPFAN